MLKHAYLLGVAQAVSEHSSLEKDAELTPYERAKRMDGLGFLSGAGGVAAGGLGGGVLGGLGGFGLSKALDLDEKNSIGLGALLGGVAGAGLGGYGGYRLGENISDEAARRSITGDVLHGMGYGPGAYSSGGDLENTVRQKLIAEGVLSG